MQAHPDFQNFFVSEHPLVLHKLSRLRAKDTGGLEFRMVLEELSLLVFFEASRTLELAPETVSTPLESTTGFKLSRRIVLVPILRAGLGMVSGIIKVLPKTRVGMIGMYRNEATLEPVDYYLRLPDDISEMEVFLLDPMLATGGSAVAALEILKDAGARQVTMVSLICAPEGVKTIRKVDSETKIFCASLDRQLNSQGYIVPGLGDAGDRYFGT